MRLRAQYLDGGLVDDGRRHGAQAAGIGTEQGAVADHVDLARDAARVVMDPAHRGIGEQVGRAAGDVQAMDDVLQRVDHAERRQMEARGDATGQLAQIRPGQHLAQLGLADQHDPQQLFLVGLEIGQQPHLFEHRLRQVLRLVDDQHCAPAGGVAGQQMLVQGIDQRLDRQLRGVAALARIIDVQLVADRGDEFASFWRGL